MRDRIVGDDHGAAALERVGVEGLADDEGAQRERDTGDPGHPLGPAPARELAPPDLRERERGPWADDAHVGREQELRAGADGGAVPHRDRRRRERREQRRGIAQSGRDDMARFVGARAAPRVDEERPR